MVSAVPLSMATLSKICLGSSDSGSSASHADLPSSAYSSSCLRSVTVGVGHRIVNGILNVNQTTRRRQAPAIISPHNQDTRADINDRIAINVKEMTRTETVTDRVNLNLATPQTDIPPFLSQLKVYNGTFSDESLWKIFTRPFALILSPVVSIYLWISVVHVFIWQHPRHGSSF